MKYDKFNDPVALLIDLCKPMTAAEKVILGALGYKLSKDEKYRKDYIQALKRFYMRNFQSMKLKKYVLRPFSRLNKELEESLGKEGNNLDLIPEYAAFDPHSEEKEKSSRERVQILRKMLQKKDKNPS